MNINKLPILHNFSIPLRILTFGIIILSSVILVLIFGVVIAVPFFGHDVMKNLANAELIVESVNAANKSGFTPCELLEQRNGLLEALTDLLNSYRNYINVSEEHLIKNALAAIEKTKATE